MDFVRKNFPAAKFIVQGNNQEIKIFLEDFDVYDKLLDRFKQPSMNVQWYTFAKKGTEKNKKYIILGLDL